MSDFVWSDDTIIAIDLSREKLIRFAEDGALSGEIDLPVGLRLNNGLSGLRLGPAGQIWVELEGGYHIADFDLDTREFELFDGYPFPGGTYRLVPGLGTTTTFAAGEVTVDIDSRFGGFISSYLIGVNPDGSFVIGTTELIENSEGASRGAEQARWFEPDGSLIATAVLPVEDQFLFVNHPVVLSAEGTLYYLQTAEEEVRVLELGWHTASE
ncbi:MAG: hypothetical protein WDZ96_08100 [Acidimicrobiia bacterium]